jgi:prepilin-type N-terminal cleavage/methylation domain-containing protein/prepilin-type processing-associated H-X9-DG protein
MKTKAFTLIELLVVIAIIAILMGIILPSLRAARDHAKRVHCVSNVKTLSLAWFMYQDDNDGELVPGHTDPGNWVLRPPSNATIEQKKQAIRDGLLFPYVGKEVDVYACPADQRDKDPGKYTFRSFSIAGGANGESWSGYTKAKKYNDLKRPGQRYIFCEEIDPRGYNVGSWQMNPGPKTWVDPVAMWHNKQSTLGFADGHAEMHRWLDQSFIEWNLRAMVPGVVSFTFSLTPPSDERNDIEYMARAFPYKSLD